MKQQGPQTLTNISHPLNEVREYLDLYTDGVWCAAQLMQRTLKRLVNGGSVKSAHGSQAFARAVRAATRLARARAKQHAGAPRHALIWLLCFCLLIEPNSVFAARATKTISPVPVRGWNTPETEPSTTVPQAAPAATLNHLNVLDQFNDFFLPEPLPVPAITDAAVSRHHPSLNGGRIEGSLRVFGSEIYAINTPFQLTGDLYALGTPQIIVNSGASYSGTINEGGAATPSNYSITLNGGLVLPGKIHIHADALALPTDIPTSVPAAAGTRTVNINTANDVGSIGTWSTVRDLNVTPANLVINVPPGNYNNFTLNAASRLNFTAGIYNFAGTINLNGGASIQTTGRVDINIAQAFNVNQGSIIPGTNTLPGDVHVNAISTGGCTLNGSSQLTGLLRCPNSTFNLNGTTAVVTGQVIANYLNINTGKITGNTSTTGAPDTTAPTISITSPANNSTSTNATITVSGAAADPGIISSGIAQVTVNNTPATYTSSNGTWTLANVALAIGSNTITARATDNAGNVSTPQAIVVIRQNPPDTTPPGLAITSPANNSTTQATTIAVSGTAADVGTNASGLAQVTVNGVSATLNTQAGTWTISNVALTLGGNTITARATDSAGNFATQAITITRQSPPDTTAPTLAIGSPANGSTSQSATITVSGTVSDPGQNASGVAQVTVNGASATLNVAAGTWIIANVALTVGSNTLAVHAVDQSGNATDQAISVTRQPPPDTTAPTLAITSPANNSTTQAETTSVSGPVSDPGQYPSGVMQVTVNGVAATIDAGCTWLLANVALAVGANTITVRAVDNAGNATTQTITVNRATPPDTQAPTITITSPVNNFNSPDATITVTGTATDQGAYATGVSRVVVNGQTAAYNSVTQQWTATGVSLSEGANTIQAFADDGAPAPNRGQTSITVTLHTPDTTAPTVAITSPLTAFDTYDATLNAAGTAVDSGLNATGVQSVSVNGVQASYNATNNQWSAAAIPLVYGDNDIIVLATDGAPTPNQGHAEVHVTRLRIPPPALVISSPQNGAVLAATSITIAGSVSSLGTVNVTVNGENAPVSGGQFTRTVSLVEGANTIAVVATDSISQQSQSSISVIRDLSPPTVSFANVPASVQPGSTYQVLVDAVDNVGVADVEFRVNGQHVATSAIAPYQFDLTIPLVYAAGSTLVLSAVARDLTNTTAVTTAQTRTAGPGGISGYAFDDATGYVLPGVSALPNADASVVTDDQGVFTLISATPTGVVRLTKDGYTPVERLYSVSIGEGTALFDARLTPLDSQTNLIGVAGGRASGDGGRLQVSFNAGTFAETTDVRLTSISPQGLASLLPYGWSPVPGAVVDLRPATASASTPQVFQSPAPLAISQVAGLTTATPLVLARYDDAAHRWIAISSGLVSADNGALTADLPRLGQYAFLVADTGSTAPPAPVMGQPLTSAQPADSAALDSAQATAVATPRTAPFSASARSAISFFAAASGQLPSGVSIEATFGETYNLLGGRDSVLVDRPAQDFVLYAYPAASSDQPNRLGAFFIAKPTRTDFTITELFNANVHVEIRSGRQTKLGVLIDSNGGGLRAGDGSQLTIPANAVTSALPLFFEGVPRELINVSLPDGYETVAAFDLDLGSATLNNSATISVPGITGDLSSIVVARLVTVGGQRSPKVIARAVADSNGKLNSTTAAPLVPAGVALSGIRTSGRYLFIRLPQAFGYVKGQVTDASSGNPLGLVKISDNQTPFIDVTGADGQFVVIGSAGTDALGVNQIGAAALTTDATGKVTASLSAQDAVANANVSVSAVPLQVESITPASNTQNMIATTPVTITFNKPIAASSVTGSSFSLSTASGNPVLGNITVLAGSRVVVLTPSVTLAAATTYKVALTQSVRDIYGHPLGAVFNSTFTTAATVTMSNRLQPEQLAISYPDAGGLSSISIPAGSVPDGSTILVVNTTSGSTVSTVAGTTALLLQIQARVGDEIVLTISQPDGTQYRVTQAAYRRADGFISVGSNGGTITSDGGQILLSIPAGAISGQADLKLTPQAESDITIPRQGEMDPANVPFGAGVRITATGNFINHQELHLEVAAPAIAPEGQRVAFMKPGKFTDAGGERDIWDVMTSGKTEGGKFMTMSPPFYGITLGEVNGNLSINDYSVFMPHNFRAVTGLVTEHVNNGAAKPLANVQVVITGTTAGTQASVRAITASNGRFGTLDFAVASADSVQIEATDSLGRVQTAGATPYLNIDPIANPGLNGLRSMYAAIEFPSSSGLPETLPALLRLEGRMLDLPTGQPDTLQGVGRVLTNSHLEIKLTATPDVKQVSGQLMAGGTVVRQLVWNNPNPGSGIRITDFTVEAEGSYSVVVTTYTQNNVPATKATATFSFVALHDPNTRPSLDGPPRVLSVTPADGARQVSTGALVHLEFSEPVKNLVAGQTIYLTNVLTGEHIGGDLTSAGLPIGPTQDNLSSIDLQPSPSLEANKEYAVEVTTEVKDADGHQLDQEYTSPDDTNRQPFHSTFKTFHSLVLTDTPPDTDSYRIATAGDLAITVTPDNGSQMHIWDVSNPENPRNVGGSFVPNYAIAFDIFEAESPADRITATVPTRHSYTTIAVVVSLSPQDTSRPINLFIYNLDDPTDAYIIGVASLTIPNSVPAYPTYVKIHHKRAYIGNSGRGGVDVVDLEAAVEDQAKVGKGLAVGKAIQPNGGFGQETKKQRATYGHSDGESAPVFSVSLMDQNVPSATPGGGAAQGAVAYVASTKLQLISFDFGVPHDGEVVFTDRDNNGSDDRLLAAKDLSPAGYALDVRAVPGVNVHGQGTDMAVLLGQDRLWIFDVTNPRDPHAYPSRSFTEMGLGPDYARRMDVEGTLAYVMFSDEVAVIDFSDPTHPFVSSTISDIGTNLRWLVVKDGFVYTLDAVGTTRTAKLRSSIGGAAALVYVHGANTDPNNVCANPVILSRTDNHMLQDAEMIFKVYGHDAPETTKMIVRKVIVSDDQTLNPIIATIPIVPDPQSPTNIVTGKGRWSTGIPVDRSALYTAELILDEGKATEFRSRPVEIPFSNLIDQYQDEWGIPQNPGIGHFPYLLGGSATMTLMIQGPDGWHTVGLQNGNTRTYGLQNEPLPKSLDGLNTLPAGRYPFTLSAQALDLVGVNETVVGNVTIGESRRDLRQPGSVVISGVELESGNLGLSHNDIPEIKNRGLSLSLTRYYNSEDSSGFNPFGYGWHHSYQVLLTHHSAGNPSDPNSPAGPYYQISGGEGGGQTFNDTDVHPGVEAHARAPFQGTLRRNQDETFDFFTRSHVRYHFQQQMDADSTAVFNVGYMGNLAYIEEPNGNRLTLNYDGLGRMFSVVDSAGRKLEFVYEQALTPFVGTMDSGSITGEGANCNNRRFMRSLRQRFLQAELGLAWRIINVKGPGGIVINYDYDGSGNLQRVTKSGTDDVSESTDDSVWQYEYNPTAGANVNPNYSHLIKAVKPPNQPLAESRKTSYEYELTQLGKPIKTINMPEGVSYGYSYTFAGSRIAAATVTDGRNNPTSYQFTPNPAYNPTDPTQAGKTMTVMAPLGAQTVITFDGYGNRLSETDPEGMTTTIRYDNGNPVERTMTGTTAVVHTSATYDHTFNKLTAATDANQKTTNYTLDSRGNVTGVLLPTSRSITMDYQANGDMESSTDQYGFKTTFESYDAYGNPLTIKRETILGGGLVNTHQTFDVRSRLRTADDDLGPTIANTYDTFDHLVKQVVTDPAGFRVELTATMTYLPEGQLATLKQVGAAQQLLVANEYDALNRRVSTTETPTGAGSFIRPFKYDKNSNLVEETDRRGVKRTHTYNALNFVTGEGLSGSYGAELTTMTAQEIDKVGDIKTVVNLYGQTVKFDYDGLHRLVIRHLLDNLTEEFVYDGEGNITSSKDRKGRETTFEYDAVNRRKKSTDPAGRVTTWTYDDSMRTVTTQQPLQGLTEAVKEDGIGRPLSRQLQFGSNSYTTTNEYAGRKVTTTDPRGTVSVRDLSAFNETGRLTINGADPAYVVEMTYAALGGKLTSKDALGRTTAYTLDGLSRATGVAYPGNFGEQFTYDGQGLILTHTDRRNVVSTMTYDNAQRELTVTAQDGADTVAVRATVYDDAQNKETRTDANGNSSIYMFDGLRRLASLTNADHKTKTYAYDGMNLLSESDFKEKSTIYEYDSLDRVTQIKDRKNQVTNIANSDNQGYTRTTTDRRGKVKVEVFDQLGRMTSATQSGEPLVSYQYDGKNNRTVMIDGLGRQSTFTYDKLNRLTTINHAGLQTETFSYDAVGNVVAYNDGRGPNVSMAYDALNQLKTTTDGEGQVTRTTYDGEGLLSDKTDPKGAAFKTTYHYNALGSLSQVTDAKGGVWSLVYDGVQNLKSVKDALNHTVSYDYDALNRVQKITQPQNRVTTYGYDENSNRNAVTDPKGQTTAIEYDELDRPNKTSYANTSGAGPSGFDLGYDPENNLTSVSEKFPIATARNYARTYDDRNRLRTTTDPFNHTVTFGYDAASNLTSLKDAAQKETTYSYDARNRLQTVTMNGGATAGYSWYADGLLQRVDYGAGMKREYSYDNADRLTQVTNTTGLSASPQTQEFLYGYDANSNRESETRKVNGQTTRSITYGYDLLDRVTAAAYATPGTRPANPPAGQSVSYNEYLHGKTFDFDAVGNRPASSAQDHTTTITLTTNDQGVTAETRHTVDGPVLASTAVFDELNRLITKTTTNDAGGPVTYAYDANGNLTSTTQSGQVTASYEYDCRNQLRRVLGGASQEVASYDYDFERHRLAKTVGASSLKYVYGGDQVIDEYEGTLLQNRYDLGAGEVVRAELGGEGTRHYFSDGLRSITALAQQNNTTSSSLIATYEYDAWGNYFSFSGASRNTIGYTGQRMDGETGLMPLGNGERYYSPGSGSFIQQDSLAGTAMTAQSMNRYSYAHGNPVVHTDPSGHVIGIDDVAAIILIGFLLGTLYGVAKQDAEIRDKTRAQTDFSLSEAVVYQGLPGAVISPVLALSGTAGLVVGGGFAVGGIAHGIHERQAGRTHAGNVDIVFGGVGLLGTAYGARVAYRGAVEPNVLSESSTAMETNPTPLGVPEGGGGSGANSVRLLAASERYIDDPARLLSPAAEETQSATTRFLADAEGNVAESSTGRGNLNPIGEQGPFEVATTIEDVRAGVDEVLSASLDRIREVAPDGKVGYRGSLARGAKGSQKQNAPFDPLDFDVDAFIVSDSLASQVKAFRGARWGNGVKSLQAIQDSIHANVKSRFPGLRNSTKDRFQFRIFTEKQMQNWDSAKDPFTIIEEGNR